MPPHQSPHAQTEPNDLPLRPPRSEVSGIRKQYVRLALILFVAVITAALVIGLGIDFRPRLAGGEREIDLPPHETSPAALAGLPDNYAEIPRPELPPQPAPTPRDGAEPILDPLGALQEQNAELRRNLASMMAAIEQIDAKNQDLLDQLTRYQDQALEAQSEAWQSAVFFDIDDASHRQSHPADSNGIALRDDRAAPFAPPAAGAPVDSVYRPQSPTEQERKLAFLYESVVPEAHLDKSYLYPRSAYELQAGMVIPAALLTGINTDLPGEIIAVVTAPVYDTRTGQHLLIPQGAKLLGNYDSEIGNGQNRALLVWHRLLMPNGRSITLDHMPGTDAAGYAGVADRVDYHADKLATGAVLSSVVAFAGNLARGSSRGGDEDARDVIGDTVAHEASRIGSKIIDRQLDVQPTITVRPGWPVRVLVNKDILLAPYDAHL